MSVNEIVNEIIKGVLQDDGSSGRRNYLKRTRPRLRKSLINQVTDMIKSFSQKDIVSKLTGDLVEKYKPRSKSTANISLMKTTEDSSSGTSMSECSSKETSSSAANISLMKTTEDSSSGTSISECSSKETSSTSETANHSLRDQIASEKKKLAKQKLLNIKWLSKNRFLSHRSRQLARIKLDSHFSSRTVLMMDAANFSDFLGYVDDVLLNAELNVIEFPEYFNRQLVALNDRFQIYKAVLGNGEFGILKQFKPRAGLEKHDGLTRLSYEAKILSLVGYHRNVVFCHGITIIDDSATMVLSYESELTLGRYLKKFPRISLQFITRVLSGLSEGVLHIHRKGILHNQIIPDNICLRHACQYYEPILIGFSYACRKDNAKKLTLDQQNTFKDSLHLPPNVKTGTISPSFDSDVYSFGRIAKRFALRYTDPRSVQESEVFKLAMSCMQKYCATLDDFEDLVDFHMLKL